MRQIDVTKMGPLGKKVVAPTPQKGSEQPTWTHVRGEVWRNSNGKVATSEHGAKHPPDWRPPLPEIKGLPFHPGAGPAADEYVGYDLAMLRDDNSRRLIDHAMARHLRELAELDLVGKTFRRISLRVWACDGADRTPA